MFDNSMGEELPLDEAIVTALPPGIRAQSIHRYGISSCSITAKITAIDASSKAHGLLLKEGEFVGMVQLHDLAPDLVPRPIAWGKLKESISDAAGYFFITDFKYFILTGEQLPDAKKLCPRLAAMHLHSAGISGRFGFGIQTYDGSRVQAVEWEDRWTPFFSKLLAEAYRQDVETNGVWPELDAAYQRVQSHLIPRLIGALEADGRPVIPVLIHGDLWDGNISIEGATGDPWVFDCGVYFAHNEMELGIWRAERHQMRAEGYRAEYFKYYEPSEPRDECDDRNRLYSAKTNFMHSAIFPGSPARWAAYNDFLYLIGKYVPWEEDTHGPAKGQQKTIRETHTT